jgi:predicted NAD/FAD-binding protein
MKVAVIGSGIAGLSSAWLLTQAGQNHQVTLYERSARVGMDASGVNVDLKALRAKAGQCPPL